MKDSNSARRSGNAFLLSLLYLLVGPGVFSSTTIGIIFLLAVGVWG